MDTSNCADAILNPDCLPHGFLPISVETQLIQNSEAECKRVRIQSIIRQLSESDSENDFHHISVNITTQRECTIDNNVNITTQRECTIDNNVNITTQREFVIDNNVNITTQREFIIDSKEICMEDYKNDEIQSIPTSIINSCTKNDQIVKPAESSGNTTSHKTLPCVASECVNMESEELENIPSTVKNITYDIKGHVSNGKKKSRRSRGFKVWEFMIYLLKNKQYNPSIIKWENKSLRIFRLIDQKTIATLWAERRDKVDRLSYDHFARTLRYHYKTGYLTSVPDRNLVYQFGSKAKADECVIMALEKRHQQKITSHRKTEVTPSVVNVASIKSQVIPHVTCQSQVIPNAINIAAIKSQVIPNVVNVAAIKSQVISDVNMAEIKSQVNPKVICPSQVIPNIVNVAAIKSQVISNVTCLSQVIPNVVNVAAIHSQVIPNVVNIAAIKSQVIPHVTCQSQVIPNVVNIAAITV